MKIEMVVVVREVIIGEIEGDVEGYRGGWVDEEIEEGEGRGRIILKNIIKI